MSKTMTTGLRLVPGSYRKTAAPCPSALRVFVACLMLAGTLAVPAALGRELSLEERVSCRTAIERVYWSHRIWPADNLQPRPSFEEALPEAAIRSRVEDVLRQSSALDTIYRRPITAAQLQAEMNRMTRDTRQPDLLAELYAALGKDPFLIAECLARPVLAERLIRSSYAHDAREHGKLRRRAEAALAKASLSGDVERAMKSMGGAYSDRTWTLAAAPVDRVADADSRPDLDLRSLRGEREAVLDKDQWEAMQRRLGVAFGVPREISRGDAGGSTGALGDPGPCFSLPNAQAGLPLRRPSPLREDDTSFTVETILERSATSIRTAAVTWEKVPFEAWWKSQGPNAPATLESPAGGYAPVTAPTATCTEDTWESTMIEVPEEGYRTGVWSGSEMLVRQGRYDPATDSWRTSSSKNAPQPGPGVWTGSEMIIWGGYFSVTNEGSRYDPATDTWTPTSMGANVPSSRVFPTVVWTGTEMIVWGGRGSSSQALNSGGRYDPVADTWTPTSVGVNVPAPRYAHTAVWTGSKMIVWGGELGANTGGRYDPATDAWTPTSTGGSVPSPRSFHSAVWSGARMIVWGGAAQGSSCGETNTGSRYDPASDTWSPTSTGGAPQGRGQHTAVWTGSEMIVWGGRRCECFGGSVFFNTGGRYNPVTDTWTTTSTGANVPTARGDHVCVWTGSEMIVWGGRQDDYPSATVLTGGRYVPSTDTWIPTSTGRDVPTYRSDSVSVWTGSEMVVWGGRGGSIGTVPFSSGSRYSPATDSWSATAASGAPAARYLHTAVWTGTEMVVWGGRAGAVLNTGGRYNPTTNAWTVTEAGSSAPSPRIDHTAVWTGREMIVWGGFSGNFLNDGGRYSPATNSWLSTSTGANVPVTRYDHSAVWTGRKMIVWGGYVGGLGGSWVNTGALYDTASNTWTPTGTGPNVPTGRSAHTAVWTGREMIVWSGRSGAEAAVGGGRYDPATAAWTPMSLAANNPSGPAVWTGTEMIVWFTPDRGGRYVPGTDTWSPTTPVGAPLSYRDNAVWTGSRMIVWGGGATAVGGLYCACTAPVPEGSVPLTAAKLAPGNPTVHLSWPAVGASGYDLVTGSLVSLHSSSGNFAIATADCLGNNQPAATFDHAPAPPAGGGFWYLVRARSCGGAGSYDSSVPPQVGLRDAEIAASGLACP